MTVYNQRAVPNDSHGAVVNGWAHNKAINAQGLTLCTIYHEVVLTGLSAYQHAPATKQSELVCLDFYLQPNAEAALTATKFSTLGGKWTRLSSLGEVNCLC